MGERVMKPYVRIEIDDWARELRQHLRELLDGVSKYEALLNEYIIWAKSYYVEWLVPLPSDMADCFYQNAEPLFREKEDRFLINEMKTRTTPMSDDEWQEYCKSKNAIVIRNDCALLTDGYFDN